MSAYETPTAVRHDAATLAAEAQALLEATAEIADQKVADARKRLAQALEVARQSISKMQQGALEGARCVDQAVRANPYQSMAVAFALGAWAGVLLRRRS
jgi:ElaB/YqjD/DUF883 family membrane-anchored ribosome-binding protein